MMLEDRAAIYHKVAIHSYNCVVISLVYMHRRFSFEQLTCLSPPTFSLDFTMYSFWKLINIDDLFNLTPNINIIVFVFL